MHGLEDVLMLTCEQLSATSHALQDELLCMLVQLCDIMLFVKHNRSEKQQFPVFAAAGGIAQHNRRTNLSKVTKQNGLFEHIINTGTLHYE